MAAPPSPPKKKQQITNTGEKTKTGVLTQLTENGAAIWKLPVGYQ